MRVIVLACAAAIGLAGCASLASSEQATGRRGDAASDAAFMGYHGPTWRENKPWH